MSFSRQFTADRRLILLRELATQPGARSTSAFLRTLFYAATGMPVTVEDVEGDIEFFQRHGLANSKILSTNVWSVSLAEHGEEYLRGGIDIEGISAPRRKV